MTSPLSKRCITLLLVAAPAFLATAASAQPAAEDTRPLSPAQVALFMTPQLQNVGHPETLQYHFTRTGKDGFEDTVAEKIQAIHPDGTKQVSFNYLSGEHHKFYPAVDNFAGNPVLMVFLESDVQSMKDSLGVSATYFRNLVREAMVDHATIANTSFTLDGRAVPAREVTVQPFADVERLERLPTVQAKSYRFVLSDAVPGGIALMQTSMPADAASGIAASGETVAFQGVSP